MNSTIFDSQNPKYKCFFGKLHVTTATKYICYFNFGLSLFYIGCILFERTLKETGLLGAFIFVFVALLMNVLLFGTPIYAVKKEKPKFLLPYLIISILCNILEVYCIGYDLINKNYEDAWILFDFVDFGLNVWFMIVFYNCYQYLVAKKHADTLPMYFSNKNVETASIIREETAFSL